MFVMFVHEIGPPSWRTSRASPQSIVARLLGWKIEKSSTEVLQNFDFLRQTAAASFLAAPSLFLLSVALGWVARRVRQRAKDLQDAPATRGKYQQLGDA